MTTIFMPREARQLASNLHMSRLGANVWVSVNYFPVKSLTLSDYFSFVGLFFFSKKDGTGKIVPPLLNYLLSGSFLGS